MSALEFGKPRRRFVPGRGLVYLVLIVVVIAGGYVLVPRFEWRRPEIKITPDTDTVGLAPLQIAVTEQGTGLKSFTAVLISGGTEYSLAAEQYDQPLMQKNLTVALSSKLTGLKEGPAVLRVTARDRSLWNFFRGNESVVQKNLIIDITPPSLELIADDRYVNFGGVGVIVYKPSPDTIASGVKIGNYFFPGYKGQIKEHPDHYLAFFAHPYNVPETEKASLVATDKAGNSREMKLVYELKNVKYKKSTIRIDDNFIQQKVAPLLNDVGARQGTPKDIFIKVNKSLRKENEDKIRSITEKSTPSILWHGAFSQLTNSKVEANFADARTYIYNNEAIDTAYHVGYDLSVTKHYAAEASSTSPSAKPVKRASRREITCISAFTFMGCRSCRSNGGTKNGSMTTSNLNWMVRAVRISSRPKTPIHASSRANERDSRLIATVSLRGEFQKRPNRRFPD